MFRGPGKNYMMGLGSAITFIEEKGENNEQKRKMLDAGENPPQGVILYYWLEAIPASPIKLTILDKAGNEVKSFTSKGADTPKEETTLPAKPGLNRFVWDMRYPDAVKVPGDLTTEKAVTGPRAAPGHYQAQLTVGDTSQRVPFTILVDPRIDVSQADLDTQFALWQQITDKISDTHRGINKLRKIRRQLDGWIERAEDNQQIVDAARSIHQKLSTIERELIQTEAKTGNDRLRLPARLNTKLIGLISIVAAADARPPQQTYDVLGHLGGQVDEQLALLDGIIGDDLAAFNDLVLSAHLTPVSV